MFLMFVQKKLQMRIEAQGKYLQAVLEKAQRTLSLDGSLEASRAQLTEFNSALSNFMENMNKDSKENIIEVSGFYNKNDGSAFHYEEVGREQNRNQKPKIEGGSIQFDLNIKGSNDLISSGGAEMDVNMISYRG
ncbi:hypothetical protein V8G54_015743 [Vigna mungo]|uniref:MYB-CC type transcription factor LHEQLE-containing domain-containing protein n=1 Tax=Vigna mungo TaxID=3915 RepID=A0AAQ3NMT9_VIGMU